jgi:hypothetical protein
MAGRDLNTGFRFITVGVQGEQIMNPKHQCLSVIVISIFLSSCTSNPVGWGGRYQVLQSTGQSITIEYDRVMSSYKEIMDVAQAHCNQTGKAAVPADEENSTKQKGLIQTHTFRCA